MPSPANLLFLLSDNHNRALAGCYGHPKATTPNLDRIAARGVRFENAYSASPLCCPARAALATVRFPHQTGYWDNAIVYDGRVPSWMTACASRATRWSRWASCTSAPPTTTTAFPKSFCRCTS